MPRCDGRSPLVERAQAWYCYVVLARRLSFPVAKSGVFGAWHGWRVSNTVLGCFFSVVGVGERGAGRGRGSIPRCRCSLTAS